MEQAARAFGVMNLIAGALMFAAPGVARNLIRARVEFLTLSDTAFRFLGAWLFLTGAATVGRAARLERLREMPEEVARKVEEGRRAA